jgi:hypothetical protein
MRLRDMDSAYDHKKAVLTVFQAMIKEIRDGAIEDAWIDPKKRFKLLTQNAFIEATINIDFESDYDEDTQNINIYKHGLSYLDQQLSELPSDLEAINLAAPLHLQNVVLNPFSTPGIKHEIGEMYLFTDQIVGVTVI